MLLTGESEFFHPAPSPANLNLNLSLEFNSTTDVNVDYEVITDNLEPEEAQQKLNRDELYRYF